MQPGNVKLADVKFVEENRGSFGYRGNGRLPFHCDLEDIIGFMTLRTGTDGGERKIASSVAVYNELVEANPTAVQTLSEPFFMTFGRGYNRPGKKFSRLPVFNICGGKLSVCGYRVHIKRALNNPDVPRLTAEQKYALEAFDEMAQSLHLEIDLRPGDIEYYNNHVVLHTRNPFEDDVRTTGGRHLLRIWLSQKGFRKLPGEHPNFLRPEFHRSDLP